MWRDEWMAKETDALAQAALRIVRERTGRLVALIVRIPADLDAERFRQQFDARLADVGLDFVDLSIDPERGPLRIVAADFHAG